MPLMADIEGAFKQLVSQFELELVTNTLKFLIADGKVTTKDVQSALDRAVIELIKPPSVAGLCAKCAGQMEPHGQCSQCGEYPVQVG